MALKKSMSLDELRDRNEQSQAAHAAEKRGSAPAPKPQRG
jgi:hypothetical protein